MRSKTALPARKVVEANIIPVYLNCQCLLTFVKFYWELMRASIKRPTPYVAL